MKIAIIGCGTMGLTHARDLAVMEGIELVGVCDPIAERATKLAEECRTKAYTSFEQLIDEADPDVVSVTLPTDLHKEYVLKAAGRGKHVVCEKPIANNLQDAREMIDFCREKGVRLFVGHVVRFFPAYADLKHQVDAGDIGRPGVAHFKRAGSHPGAGKPWYGDSAVSGGVILDLMIHDIDYVRWIMGEVESVYALRKTSEGVDYALVTLRMENGSLANLEGHWGYPGPFHTSIEIAGSAGVLRSSSEEQKTVRVVKNGGAENELSPTERDPYYYELSHFLNCIRTGEEPRVTAEDALRATEIALAAIRSAETGLPVEWKGGANRA